MLTPNAIHVLEQRYLRKDSTGKIIETPEQLFERVASISKSPELKFRILNHLLNLHVLPNSPTLMNANTELGQLSACISGNTYIYTRDGLKYMKDISPGDQVLTHSGNFKNVLKVWSNGVKDTIKLSHGTERRKNFNLVCTPEHKIQDNTGAWIEADKIEIYKAKLPTLWKSAISFPNDFKMSEFISGIDKKVLVIDGKVRLLRKGRYGKKGLLDEQVNPCLDIIKNDDILARIFGLYLANGNIDEYAIRFCLNSDDNYNIDFLMNNFEKKFGCLVRIEKSNQGNWVTIKMDCKFVTNLFHSIFGNKFYNKKMPEWISNAPESYKKNIFDGLMSDAHENEAKKITLVLANPTLVYQSILLGRSIGYLANFKADARERLSKNPTSKAQFLCTNYNPIMQTTSINNIVKTKGESVEVFDMEVEGDHSFVAGDFIVHNCFVLSVEDSMSGIFDAVKNTAIIHKSGGGTGYNFSHLRPEGAFVKSTQGKSSGPLPFMQVFHAATDVVIQGGKRRGAMMGCLNCDHPDILKFIHAKDKGTTLSNFNLSVVITDAFMNAVLNNSLWELKFKDKIYQTLPAKEIFNQIVQHAWESGDPGLLFIDTANKNNSGPKFESSNPCGEQFLLPNESCNLASINLKNMLIEDKSNFDYDKIDILIKDLVPFMNDIIDANKFPLPEIKKATLKTRRIGIGVMGWADALSILKIPYNSPDALHLAEEVMSTINSLCHKVSCQLNDGVTELNQNLTTIAPTGTISVIADVSSGIEPIYAVAYKRNLASTIGKDLNEVNPIFLEIAKSRGFYSDTLVAEIIKNHGSIQSIPYIPSDIKSWFLTAHDIAFEDHIAMQSAFQKYTDSAVSKTINLLESATPQNIYDAYMLAWKSGCKGITIYRNNSKNLQVLTTESSSVETLELEPINDLTPRPDILPAMNFMKKSGCTTLFVTPTMLHNGSMLESFIDSTGKSGCRGMQDGLAISISVNNRYIENLPRKITVDIINILQKYTDKINNPTKMLEYIMSNLDTTKYSKESLKILSDHLLNITCKSSVISIEKQKHNNGKIHKVDSLSCPNAVAQCIKYMLEHDIEFKIDGKSSFTSLKSIASIPVSIDSAKKCKECGSTNIDSTNCATCLSCGASKCL